MENHSQRNIYVQNFIRAKHYSFSPAYSELIGRLCAVESAMTMRDSVEGFCTELLTAFKGSRLYESIDRSCLAMRIGLSNELATIDSANSVRVEGCNIMTPGYRCFVRKKSSLFSLREGEIRIYDDATRVAQAFEKKDRPIQRSLSYVLQMGFRSGICVPLHSAGSVRGFLFFNSQDAGLFGGLVDEDYAVLNIVSMIAKLALFPKISSELTLEGEYHKLRDETALSFDSEVFDETQFEGELQAAAKVLVGETWRPRVTFNEGVDGAFLYSPATIAYLIVKACAQFHLSTNEFPKEIVVSSADGQTVEVKIPMSDASQATGLDAYRRKVLTLGAQLGFLRARLSAGINCIIVQFPFDPVFRGREGVFYSV